MAWKSVQQIIKDENNSFFTSDIITALSQYNTLVSQMSTRENQQFTRALQTESYLSSRIQSVSKGLDNTENTNDPKYFDTQRKHMMNIGKSYNASEYPKASADFTTAMQKLEREEKEFGVYQTKMQELDDKTAKGIWNPQSSYWVGKTAKEIADTQGEVRDLMSWLNRHGRLDEATKLQLNDNINDLETLLHGAVGNDGVINEDASYYHAMQKTKLSDALVSRGKIVETYQTKLNNYYEQRKTLVEDAERITQLPGFDNHQKNAAIKAVSDMDQLIKQTRDEMDPYEDAYLDKISDWGGYEESAMSKDPRPDLDEVQTGSAISSQAMAHVPKFATSKLTKRSMFVDHKGRRRKLTKDEQAFQEQLIEWGYNADDEMVLISATDLNGFEDWASGNYGGPRKDIHEYFEDQRIRYDKNEKDYKLTFNMSKIYNLFSQEAKAYRVDIYSPLTGDEDIIKLIATKTGIGPKAITKYLNKNRENLIRGQQHMKNYYAKHNVIQPEPVSPKAKGVQAAWNAVKQYMPKVDMDTYNSFAGQLIQSWMNLPQADKDKYGDFDSWVEQELPEMVKNFENPVSGGGTVSLPNPGQ